MRIRMPRFSSFFSEKRQQSVQQIFRRSYRKELQTCAFAVGRRDKRSYENAFRNDKTTRKRVSIYSDRACLSTYRLIYAFRSIFLRNERSNRKRRTKSSETQKNTNVYKRKFRQRNNPRRYGSRRGLFNEIFLLVFQGTYGQNARGISQFIQG